MLCLVFVEINKIDSPEEYSNSRILPVISRSFKPRDILYSKIGNLDNSKVGHFGVKRILKRYQAENKNWKTGDSTSNGSLITVPVVKKLLH